MQRSVFKTNQKKKERIDVHREIAPLFEQACLGLRTKKPSGLVLGRVSQTCAMRNKMNILTPRMLLLLLRLAMGLILLRLHSCASFTSPRNPEQFLEVAGYRSSSSPPHKNSQKFLAGESSVKCCYLIGLSIRPAKRGATYMVLPIDGVILLSVTVTRINTP